MTSLPGWLEEIGLERYVPVFAQNDIDFEALRLLNEKELAELGVSLGHRKKLLQALATLAPNLPLNSSSDTAVAAPAWPVVESVTVGGERRQITVLFCDLVGSTALASRLDPEELRDLMQVYRRTCGEAVARYDGHVAQYLGDGIMAYFGWPRAHEDEAERAVRAALEVVQSVRQISTAQPLHVRLGIATGSVVVGDAGKGGDDQLAVGETPNLAARLQGLAGPDEIVISPSTRRLIGSAFELIDLGEQVLRGIVEPVRTWKVEALSRSEGRFEAAHRAVALTPLVGREEELALLLRRWAQAKEGEGQVVLIGGQPGIGKSRLSRVLREHIAAHPYMILRYQCSPFHQNSALYPMIEQFEYAAGFTREQSPEQKLDKMEAVLAGSPDEIAQVVPLFAALLSLPLERYPSLNLSPAKQKEKTLEALIGQVEALARPQPVLMLYEDVHWIDATSQETLDLLVPRLQSLPVLLLITYRPEYTPRWQDHPHVSTLGLNRLTRRQGAVLVEGVTGGKGLPLEVIEQIVAKTDGVPLFVEELTKTVLESGLLTDKGNRFELSGPLPALALPSTLRDSLIARLDRLAAVKDIAQIGACIGREFAYGLLRRLTATSDNALDQALQQLVDAGLIFRKGMPPDAVYTFKHALVQDAAYDSLLKSKRQELHAQIAKAIEDRDPAKLDTEPELLAHHCTCAGLNDRAVPLWIAAGQRALSRVAGTEAIVHLNAALKINTLLAPSTQRDQRELHIRVLLSEAHLYRGGWAAIEIAQTLRPARELAIRLGRNDQLLPILTHTRDFHGLRCEFPEALTVVDEIHAVARSSGDSSAAVLASWLEAEVRCWAGDLVGARRCGDRVLMLYAPQKHAHMADVFKHDPKCSTLVWAGYWLWALGYPDQARQASEENLEHARRVGRIWNLVWVLYAGIYAHLLHGDLSVVRQREAEAFAIASEHGLSFMRELVRWRMGLVRIAAGEYEQGYRDATAGEAVFRATEGLIGVPWSIAERAKALAGLGRQNEAKALVKEAVQLTDRTGHRMWEAETHRIAGFIALAGLDPDTRSAETSFHKSLEVARVQEAKGFELRTATSLARLWQSQGKRKQAYDLLAPVYAWFTEGFDTRDLKDARALLDELK